VTGAARPFAPASPGDRERHDPAVVFEAGLRNHHVSNTAYPIAHGTTWRPYRVSGDRADSLAAEAWAGVDELCLYVHVPFCETRCSFCEYTVVRRSEHELAERYVDDLLGELDLWCERVDWAPRRFLGFDVGGGTPSFLPAREMERVVSAVSRSFVIASEAGWSIETTPKIAAAEPEKLAAWRSMGFSRVSMGVQVIEPDLLRVLNREENGIATHDSAVENVRKAGFADFNVDLMYGFAGQSPESWRATLDHAISLDPEAITLYRMRYKLTRISHQAPGVSLSQVVELGRLAKDVLRAAGFHANPGKTTWSRDPARVGTSAYLERRVRDLVPYLGLGLGAQSFSPTTISYNAGAAGKNLQPHHRLVQAGRLPLQDLYDLPVEQVRGKACAVSFYFGEIDRQAFAARFGETLEEAFPEEVRCVLDRGLMEWTDRSLRLTPEGAERINGVIALFHAPSIQRHLIARDPDAATDFERSRRAALATAD